MHHCEEKPAVHAYLRMRMTTTIAKSPIHCFTHLLNDHLLRRNFYDPVDWHLFDDLCALVGCAN